MKIVLAGGTGQVGTLLARHYHAQGHEVVVLTRRPTPQAWRSAYWDAETLGDWAQELEGADAVFGLAGRNVNCRYTPTNRRAIMDSRVNSTRILGHAIAQAQRPPKTWLQASTATIYAHRFDTPNDEATGILGGDEAGAPKKWNFSVEVGKAWEQAANESQTPYTRKVLLRSTIVLGPERGGILDTLLRLVRFGLGGMVHNGKQWVSWIHKADFVSVMDWLLQRPDIDGVLNVGSPHPVTNVDFMRTLRNAYKMPIGLPAAKWMLEIGTWLLRTESELVLKSRYAAPSRLQAEGFEFQFPHWQAAAEDLCARWREQS